MTHYSESPDRAPLDGDVVEAPARSPRALQRRALAGLDYEAQLAAVRPTGPVPPLQFQTRGTRDGDPPDPVAATLDDLGEVGSDLNDAIEASRRAREVLERVALDLMVAGRGPQARELERLIDGLQAIENGLGVVAGPIARLGDIRAVVENVHTVYTNLEQAAATPIDPDLIARDPRATLEGYTAYYRAAAAACRAVSVVPGLGTAAETLADLFDAIPNAIENMYAVFAQYTERIDAMLEDATEVSYEIFPDNPLARREGVALMNDMRSASDIGYRNLRSRVDTLLAIPAVVASLPDDAREQAAANAGDLQQRFYNWLVDPMHSRGLELEHVRRVHERYERFMLGSGNELRGGTPFTVIGQLATHGSAEAALRHLLNTGHQ